MKDDNLGNKKNTEHFPISLDIGDFCKTNLEIALAVNNSIHDAVLNSSSPRVKAARIGGSDLEGIIDKQGNIKYLQKEERKNPNYRPQGEF